MNQLGESLPNFIFAVVNLDPIVLEKRWTDGESWPYDFGEKVNRGEDLRWVGSRWPLTHALLELSTITPFVEWFSALRPSLAEIGRKFGDGLCMLMAYGCQRYF